MRTFYSIKSFFQLRKSMKNPKAYDEFWQAGKSVESIDSIKSVAEVMADFTA
jgi:hypothetical protein